MVSDVSVGIVGSGRTCGFCQVPSWMRLFVA